MAPRRRPHPTRGDQPALTDGVVEIRPFELRDVETVAAWDADEETQRWFDWPTTRPAGYDRLASAHATVEAKWESWASGGEMAFIIREPPGRTGEAIGWCDLRLAADGCGEISYGVLSGHRGRGITSRAVTLLARYAFEELGAVRLELNADELNAASVGVARRVGFTGAGHRQGGRLRAV